MRDSGQLSVEYVALGGIPYPHELPSAAVVELKADDNITLAVAVDIVKRDTFKRLFCVGDALGKHHAVKEHLLGGVTVKRSRSVAYGHEHIHALSVMGYRSVGDHDSACAPIVARSIA